ncbi:MAG: restriction endonuclease subunit S [Melioribacteraceae bacterium]|nr:restriction endonuclease subunit S [Melioribacteraceae bacterium]
MQDVVSVLGDGLHGTPKYDDNGEYYFINGNNLSNGKIVIKENTRRANKEEYDKYKKDLNNRTILVSINGTLGNIALYNNEKCFLGKSACYFNVLDEVDKLFIRYVVTDKTFQEYISNFAHGTTIKNVSLKTMREYPFLLPPLPEQKAIAGVLSSLDNKIDLLHRQNKTLEAMAETLFRQWFVEETDERWKVSKLSDIAIIQNGFAFKSSDYNEFQEGYLEVLKMGHIERGGGLRKNPKRDYVLRENKLKKWVLNKGDIVMAMTDMKDNVVILGVPAMIDKENNYVLNQRVARIYLRNNEKLINNYLLYIQLKNLEFIANLQSKANSGVQVNLSTTTISDCDIVIPPIEIQKECVDVITQLFWKKEINDKQIRTLEKLRDTLLPKLMSGEVRVKFN